MRGILPHYFGVEKSRDLLYRLSAGRHLVITPFSDSLLEQPRFMPCVRATASTHLS